MYHLIRVLQKIHKNSVFWFKIKTDGNLTLVLKMRQTWWMVINYESYNIPAYNMTHIEPVEINFVDKFLILYIYVMYLGEPRQTQFIPNHAKFMIKFISSSSWGILRSLSLLNALTFYKKSIDYADNTASRLFYGQVYFHLKTV